MDPRSRPEAVRLAAAAAYLPFVAFGLLARRKLREDRLVRFHAYQAIALGGSLVAGLMAASILSTYLAGWGLLLDLALWAWLMAMLLVPAGLAFYGAVMAYQGHFTGIPILTDWAWTRVNGNQAEAPDAEERPRRRRRRLAEGELPPLPPIPPMPPAPDDGGY